MIRTQQEAKALLAELERTQPGAFALARAVSLAARVEPELLRAARLRLFPQFTAGDEADFWFSDCVESSGSLWVLLAPAVAEELRADLAARGDAQRARELVVEMHANAAPLVQLEETIHWLSLGGPARAKDVEAALKPVLQAVRQPDDGGVAQWAAHTIPRFSTWVSALPVAWAIRIVAEQRLGGTIAVDAGASAMPPEAAAILRDLLPTTEVWVRLTAEHVEISRERLLGGHAITVPATEPIVITVTDSESTRNVALHGAVQRVSAWGPVTIGTITGASWGLTPKETTERRSVAFRFSSGGGDFIPMYTRADPGLHVAFIVPDPSGESLRLDVPSTLVIFVPRADAPQEQWAVFAERQQLAFGSRPFVSGKEQGDFAITINVDGALVGIVALSTTRFKHLDTERLRYVCGGAPEQWVARHHVTILVMSDLFTFSDTSVEAAIVHWGFSFTVHGNRPWLSLERPVLLSAARPFRAELDVGPERELRIDSGNERIATVVVPINLHPLVVELPEPEEWVLIAGSSYKIDPFVESVARAVGQELAREGIGLITGGWRGIDEIVAMAYADTLKGRGAGAVSRSIRHILGTIQPRAEVPGERLLLTDDETAVLESIRRADAVLLVAGYGGTAWIAEEARKQQKRIVPIGETGGFAHRLAELFGLQPPSPGGDPHALARAAVAQLRSGRAVSSQEPIREGAQFGRMRKVKGPKRSAGSKRSVKKVQRRIKPYRPN